MPLIRREELLTLLHKSRPWQCLAPVTSHKIYVSEKKLLFDLPRVMFLSGSHLSLGEIMASFIEPAQLGVRKRVTDRQGWLPLEQLRRHKRLTHSSICRAMEVIPRAPGILTVLVQEVKKFISQFPSSGLWSCSPPYLD